MKKRILACVAISLAANAGVTAVLCLIWHIKNENKYDIFWIVLMGFLQTMFTFCLSLATASKKSESWANSTERKAVIIGLSSIIVVLYGLLFCTVLKSFMWVFFAALYLITILGVILSEAAIKKGKNK